MLDNPTLVGRIVSATDLCQRRKFPKSLRLLRAILKEAADAPPALLASVYVTLAGVLLKTGEFGALKLCCMNAMTLFHDTNDWQPMLRVVHGVRQAEWLMGDYEGAMRTLAMHMKMMRELNMERSMEYVILLSRMIIMRSRMPPRIVGWQITVDMQAVVAQLPPPPEGIRDKEELAKLLGSEELAFIDFERRSDPSIRRHPCANAACWEQQGPFKACARCRTVLYCSRACQRAHWPVHGAWCAELRG